MQLVFYYGFLKLNKPYFALADWQYYLLILATVLIAAGGYIINNIMDVETDEINKPKQLLIGKEISEAKAYNLYVGLTITGVAIGFYLSNIIFKPSAATLFILIASLLYFYATTLKQIPLIGNIVIAFIVGFSIFIINIFQIFPNTDDSNRAEMSTYFYIILDYSIFAFLINFIREIIKDIEDVKGDKQNDIKTLAVTLGVKKTSYVVIVLLLISTLLLLNYTNTYLMKNSLYFAVVYGMIFIIAPLIFCTIKTYNSLDSKDFKLISLLLKWIMFFGILSITIITLNIKHNAKI
jgi:4-hydroxybenzoate polyprenyltransferase